MEENKIFDLLEKIYIEVQDTKNEVKKHTLRLDNLESEVKKIGVKIDNDLIPTDKALLDGYKHNSENIAVIDDKIDQLQIDVNNLTMKTVNNDSRIIEMSKNLKRVK